MALKLVGKTITKCEESDGYLFLRLSDGSVLHVGVEPGLTASRGLLTITHVPPTARAPTPVEEFELSLQAITRSLTDPGASRPRDDEGVAINH